MAALVVLVLGCLSAPAAFAVDPSFTVDPPSPIAGAQATFSSSDIPTGAIVTWDYEATGTFVPDNTPNTHTFPDAGSYTVTMRVNDGTDHDFTKAVAVRPVVAFHRDPDNSVLLETGAAATFISDSSTGSTLNWEIDGVAFGGAQSVTHSFAGPGTHIVRLEAVQNGQRDIAASVFRVNAPPVAGFVWSPGSPLAGGQVELYSTSVDAEGALASEAWELDGDGDFDDAFGPSATQSFTAGAHDVSLRVTDGDGVSREVTRTITVTAPVVPPGATPLVTFMNPFPTVRLAGAILPRGARIRVLEVRGPRGVTVTVRCAGGGCPFRVRRRIAETGRVRLSNFERVLVAGASIKVFVRAQGVIGRYVGFRIRAGKGPVRTERCLLPGVSKPVPCPS